MARCGSSMHRQSKGIFLSLFLGIVFSYVLSPYLNNDCFSSLDKDSLINLRDSLNGDSYKGDDYEPKINFAGKPLKAKKTPQNLVRPRYYSSELGIRDKLLIGVLTKGETVNNLAVAINKTSTHIVDKVLFFIDAAEASKANVLSLKLQGIVGFIDTKEILKPFHVMKYFIENYIDDYDFFFLIKDKAYINVRMLLRVLSKVSVSEDIHAGGLRAGEDSNFCSLDGGLLLSNSIIKGIGSSMDWCVKNAFSDNDEDNLGRCILHASKLPCTQSIQGSLFESLILPTENQLEFVSQPLQEAITYSSINDPNVMYQLHYQLSKKGLVETKHMIESLRSGMDGQITWPVGSYPSKQPVTRFDLIPWQYFDLSNLYFPSSRENIKPLSGPTQQDIQKVVEMSVSWLIEKYRGELSYRRLVNGYMRFDQSRGLDYILDLAFKDSSGRETIKRVEASKPLGRVEVLSVPYVTENSRVSVLLPVRANSSQQAINFMKKYSQTFMQASELTFLLLILLYDPSLPGKGHSQDIFKEVKELAQDLTFKHRKDYSKIAWLSIKVPLVNGGPPPLYDDLLYFAMVDLVMKKLPHDSLVLFSDPYVDLNVDYINRVRMNTISTRLVYSPMPFTEFRPDLARTKEQTRGKEETLEIHRTSGHFNPFNIRHISFYTSDFFAVRKEVLSYLPAVKFDRDVAALIKSYDSAVNHASKTGGGEKPPPGSLLELFSTRGGDISVLRAPEPALKLFHSDDHCAQLGESVRGSPRTKQLTSCLSERDVATATRSQLASAILDLNLTHLH